MQTNRELETMTDHHPQTHTEGPGPAIVFAYAAFTLWGLVLGLTLGWLIWG